VVVATRVVAGRFWVLCYTCGGGATGLIRVSLGYSRGALRWFLGGVALGSAWQHLVL